MTLPQYQEFMLPMLSLLADGQTRRMPELRDLLAKHFSISDSEREELLPSRRQQFFYNRVAWARTDLVQRAPSRVHPVVRSGSPTGDARS